MQTNLTHKEGVNAKFEVTIPAEDVDKTYDLVLRSVARQVRVPGFRPGKAPKGVLIKQIGQDSLNQEVRDALVEQNYPKAVKELELTPIHAHFDAKEPSEGSDFTFEVEVDLYPDFSLPDFNEIIIDSAAPPLTDAMVEEAAAELQRENAVQIPVERPIEPGDYVLVETVRDEGEESGSVLPIDLERVDEAFAAQLIGKATGDEIELDLTAGSQDDEDEALEAQSETDDEASDEKTLEAADEAEEAEAAPEMPKLKVIVKDVKEKEKPELDDELAKTLGFETWQEVDAKIRENLQAQLDADAFEEQREEFIDKLVEEVELELPKSLVSRRKANLLNNLAQDLQKNGVSIDAYLKKLDADGKREEFDAELEASANAGVKRDLVLEQLLEQRGTKVSDEELEDAVRYLAMRERKDPKSFKKEMGTDWLENYRFLLMRDRAVRETVRELLGIEDEDKGSSDEVDIEDSNEDAADEPNE